MSHVSQTVQFHDINLPTSTLQLLASAYRVLSTHHSPSPYTTPNMPSSFTLTPQFTCNLFLQLSSFVAIAGAARRVAGCPAPRAAAKCKPI